DHLEGGRAEAANQNDEQLIVLYTKHWPRYITASTLVHHTFRYLNRRWVEREIDEGHKQIYDIYMLSLVSWREHMFRGTERNVIAAALHQFERQRNGKTIDTRLMHVGSLEELIDDDHAIISAAPDRNTMSALVIWQLVMPVRERDELEKAPTESCADVGGLDQQIQEIKLPLTHAELYEELGIQPPKGDILYGSPEMANQTSATFLRIVGLKLIQKYIGDGLKLVKELFRVAGVKAPLIVFIDEVEAVGTKRSISTVPRTLNASLKFPIGSTLDNARLNLNVKPSCQKTLTDVGFRLEDFIHEEVDAAFRIGGPDRFAACFMDSLATLGHP
ncbi:ATPase of 26S proteasome regulatory subunit 4, partial [Rhizophlyctis rosea]